MARTASSLNQPAETLPPLNDGVELVYLSGGLAFLPEQGREAHVHFLTLLVNLSPDPMHRGVVRDVGFSLRDLGFKREVMTGRTWEATLRERLASYPPGRINAAFLLPRFEPSTYRTARRALEAVQDDSSHTFGVVAAVAESPVTWRDLKTLDGFIKSTSISLPFDATAMFALLATFMAPTMLTCSEDSDVAESLGDHVRPSVIAIAMWDLEQRTLRFLNSQDREAVANAEALSLSPLWFEGSWNVAHELMNQVRPIMPASASYTYNVSTEFFSASHSIAGSRCAPVVILSRRG